MVLELNILTGCDGVGKTKVYEKLMDQVDNALFVQFPTQDIRYFISQIPSEFNDEYPLMRHKMFEVDFHNFFNNFENKDTKVVMDRFFPCNMAYGLYNIGDHPWVLSTLDYIKNFIDKDTKIKINILHISPNIEKWVEFNGENMNTSFLFAIEECYQKVYNYLREKYTGSDMVSIAEFYNNYDGELEKELIKYQTFKCR